VVVALATPVSPELQQEGRIGSGTYVFDKNEYELTYDTIVPYTLLIHSMRRGGDAARLQFIIRHWENVLVRKTLSGSPSRTTIGYALTHAYDNFENFIQQWTLGNSNGGGAKVGDEGAPSSKKDLGLEARLDELAKAHSKLQQQLQQLSGRGRGGGKQFDGGGSKGHKRDAPLEEKPAVNKKKK